MVRAASPSGIFEWIRTSVRARPSDSAALRFERMESQSARTLPEIYHPLDPRAPGHWTHRGFIWDYLLSLGETRRVLDIGPGDGWPALLMAPHVPEVVGIEPGERRVAVCRANAQRLRIANACFEQMSACALRFPSDSFDGVVAASSIEQTTDPVAALGEVLRVLRPGGVFRMSYEVLDASPEPAHEAVLIQKSAGGGFLIDYTITWAPRREQRDYLIEIPAPTPVHRAQLEDWADRCARDEYPHRDPRLECGLAQAIKALAPRETGPARVFRLRHFRTPGCLRVLERVGFRDVRLIVGGGLPARQMAEELIRAGRIDASAPIMDELCRAAACIGIAMETRRGGELIARKPERRARRARPRACQAG